MRKMAPQQSLSHVLFFFRKVGCWSMILRPFVFPHIFGVVNRNSTDPPTIYFLVIVWLPPPSSFIFCLVFEILECFSLLLPPFFIFDLHCWGLFLRRCKHQTVRLNRQPNKTYLVYVSVNWNHNFLYCCQTTHMTSSIYILEYLIHNW